MLTKQQKSLLDYSFTVADVNRALLSIPKDKAPGLDGYNNYFFKHCRDDIGRDVSAAILDFFQL